jgi:hypothetical protein
MGMIIFSLLGVIFAVAIFYGARRILKHLEDSGE